MRPRHMRANTHSASPFPSALFARAEEQANKYDCIVHYAGNLDYDGGRRTMSAGPVLHGGRLPPTPTCTTSSMSEL